MIQSMTGFAVQTRDLGGLSLHLELRSVNSRYLDLGFRIVDDLRAKAAQVAEDECREAHHRPPHFSGCFSPRERPADAASSSTSAASSSPQTTDSDCATGAPICHCSTCNLA